MIVTSIRKLILVFASLLVFVWPIEKTIALRYILAAIVFLLLLLELGANKSEYIKRLVSRPILVTSALILFLSLWLLIQAAFVVPDAGWVWDELRGQWLKDVLFWVFGVGFGVICGCQTSREDNCRCITPKQAIAIGLGGIVVWNVAASMIVWLSTGELPLMHNVTGAKATDSYVNNMLLAFVVSALLEHRVNRKGTTKGLAILFGVLLVAICIVNTIFLGARNGWIALAMFFVSWLVILYLTSPRGGFRKLIAYGFTLCLLIGIAAWGSWKTDVRWQNFIQTVPIAWDIDSTKFWLNGEKYPRPVTRSGEVVDSSNYDRIAWIHAGSRLIINNPWGGGFSRHAFGRELARVFPESEPSQGMHAHSGIIDFGVGVGIPGLIIWFALMITLIGYGGIAYFSHANSAGLALVFLTSGFLGRSFLDGSMRDHMMEQYLFIAGCLLASIAAPWQRSTQTNAGCN